MDQTIWLVSVISVALVIVVLGIFLIKQSLQKNGSLRNDFSGNKTLRGLAISLVVGGIVFGTDRYIAYSFFGMSILLSIIDMIKNRR